MNGHYFEQGCNVIVGNSVRACAVYYCNCMLHHVYVHVCKRSMYSNLMFIVYIFIYMWFVICILLHWDRSSDTCT